MPIGVETERFRAESLSEGTHTSLYVRQCGHACVYALLTYTVPAISYISLSSVDPRTPNRNLPTKSLNGLGSQFPARPCFRACRNRQESAHLHSPHESILELEQDRECSKTISRCPSRRSSAGRGTRSTSTTQN